MTDGERAMKPGATKEPQVKLRIAAKAIAHGGHVKPPRAIISADPSMKLPSGSRLAKFKQVVAALIESNIDEREAHWIAADEANKAGLDWPCIACFEQIHAVSLGDGVLLFKYRLDMDVKGFYLVLRPLGSRSASKTAQVVAWFEAFNDRMACQMARKV